MIYDLLDAQSVAILTQERNALPRDAKEEETPLANRAASFLFAFPSRERFFLLGQESDEIS